MNNEIKEILDYLANKENDIKGINFLRYQDLTRGQINLLLDYITNLQQENERLKYELNAFKNDKVYERLGKLREEKDNLYLDNTMLKMEKNIYKQGYEELKELIEKTITEVNND